MNHLIKRYLVPFSRAGWMVYVLFLLGFWLVSVPVFLQRAANGLLPVEGLGSFSPMQEAITNAARWGVGINPWAWIHILVTALCLLVFSVVSGLILWKVQTSFGLLTACVLVAAGYSVMDMVIYSAELWKPGLFVWEISGVIWPFFMLWIYLFPDGRGVPRRLFKYFLLLLSVFGLPFFIYMLLTSLPITPGTQEFFRDSAPVMEILVFPLLITVLIAQIYRYFKISGPEKRLQTRWFVFGLTMFIFPSIILEDFLGWKLPAEVDDLFFLAMPVGIGISILRYRLWDFDLIIRRTLQYTILTGILALVYFGGITILQGVFVAVSGQQSPVATVLSTLAIAALFTPLRHRIQAFIDRRFYRKKFDAEKALGDFAAIARQETNINTLYNRLIDLVQDILEPEAISVWQRPLPQRSKMDNFHSGEPK